MSDDSKKLPIYSDAPLVVPEGDLYHNEIKYRLICISGLTQHSGRLTGFTRLSYTLHNRYGCPRVAVDLKTWKENWEQFAEEIWLAWQERGGIEPRIMIAGYSRGGWGAQRLACHLDDRGLEVEQMVLIDPVLWGKSLLWRWSKIRLPTNVKEVNWLYQRTNWPCGHEVIGVPHLSYVPTSKQERKNIEKMRTIWPTPIVYPGIQVHASHQYIDDSPKVRLAVLEAAKITMEAK